MCFEKEFVLVLDFLPIYRIILESIQHKTESMEQRAKRKQIGVK